MKPTFSPWKPYLATIALFGAIVAYDMFETTSFRGADSLWSANGVVRSLRGADPVVAEVAMDDGSVVEAPVAAGLATPGLVEKVMATKLVEVV